MAYENLSENLLDYYPCRYGKSKLLFRGPKRRLDKNYIAFLGGSATYGKFVEQPFVNQFEAQSGIMSVNLGCINAGIDVYVNDQSVLDVCNGAEITVIQVLGAQNMSNRFYSVHPRRNDRFVRASNLLQTIYREVDFTEYNFTRHLMTNLWEMSPERFEIVRCELKDAWQARMRVLLSKIEGKKLLLWVAETSPDDEPGAEHNMGEAPLCVDRQMLRGLSDLYSDCLEIVMPEGSTTGNIEGMVLSPLEEQVGQGMMPLNGHKCIADALHPVLTELVTKKGPRDQRAF